ncbi:MAG: hypothetical protein WA857_01580 [Candidatus Acidiferrum sp.]
MAKPLNFNALLGSLPEDDAIETAYLVIRLLRYRTWIRASKTDRSEAMLHVVTKDRGKGQPDSAAQQALAIARAIEKEQGAKFEDIKDKAADIYVKSLADFVLRQFPTDSKVDRARAKTLLADLRRDSDSLIGNGLLRR